MNNRPPCFFYHQQTSNQTPPPPPPPQQNSLQQYQQPHYPPPPPQLSNQNHHPRPQLPPQQLLPPPPHVGVFSLVPLTREESQALIHAHGQDVGSSSSSRAPSKKVKLCDRWKNNRMCKAGPDCPYAHGEDERLRHPQWCTNMMSYGYCPYGNNCHFMH